MARSLREDAGEGVARTKGKSGFVVGYVTATLRGFGIELRQVLYLAGQREFITRADTRACDRLAVACVGRHEKRR